ncbi:hypothetical protein B5P43_24420 [Bacillus sp. SRB_336]|nr:hypothetical protein B5P43_24420 [Bacillus sp. SRB_336]
MRWIPRVKECLDVRGGPDLGGADVNEPAALQRSPNLGQQGQLMHGLDDARCARGQVGGVKAGHLLAFGVTLGPLGRKADGCSGSVDFLQLQGARGRDLLALPEPPQK